MATGAQSTDYREAVRRIGQGHRDAYTERAGDKRIAVCLEGTGGSKGVGDGQVAVHARVTAHEKIVADGGERGVNTEVRRLGKEGVVVRPCAKNRVGIHRVIKYLEVGYIHVHVGCGRYRGSSERVRADIEESGAVDDDALLGNTEVADVYLFGTRVRPVRLLVDAGPVPVYDQRDHCPFVIGEGHSGDRVCVGCRLARICAGKSRPGTDLAAPPKVDLWCAVRFVSGCPKVERRFDRIGRGAVDTIIEREEHKPVGVGLSRIPRVELVYAHPAHDGERAVVVS